MPKPKKIELNIVRLAPDLAAQVDAWAAAHAVDRAVAIPRLVELGLTAEAGIAAAPPRCRFNADGPRQVPGRREAGRSGPQPRVQDERPSAGHLDPFDPVVGAGPHN